MDKIVLEALPAFLKQYGALGLAIVVLMAAVWLLWVTLEKRNREVAELAKAGAVALAEATATMKSLEIAIGVQTEDNKDRMQALTVLTTQGSETNRALDRVSQDVREFRSVLQQVRP